MLKGKRNARPKKTAKQGEGIKSGLFSGEVPVWYDKRRKVCPKWASRCAEEKEQTREILEEIASLGNLETAYRKVKKNKGSAGVDGEGIGEFGAWFKSHNKELTNALLTGTYRPNKVRGVEIPKASGGKRLLGIPTIKDRVVQQAIAQVMGRYYETTFTESSHGFRPRRGTRSALDQARQHIKEGKSRIVDIDLKNFFDEVHHERLMWLLGTRMGDRRLLDLIRKILRSGILIGGLVSQRIKGTPQGSPLSPLLSNIVLDELDQELERRGLSYVRYADDLLIFTGSTRSAERVYRGISEYIKERMKLKVNEEKSGIRKLSEVTFLGYGLGGGGRLYLSKKSEEKLKVKLKEKTARNRGVSLEQVIKEVNEVLRGWLNYFIKAEMKGKMKQISSWLKRRLRSYRLKQCKRVIGLVRFLRRLGVNEKLSWRTALSGKSWWRLSNSPGSNIGMNDAWFKKIGLYDIYENYTMKFNSY